MYMWWISSIAFLCFSSPVFLKGELGLVGRAQDKLCQGTRRSSCGKTIVGDWNKLVYLSKTWPIDEPAFESKSQLLSVTYITIVAKFVIDPWIEQFLVLVQPNLARYIKFHEWKFLGTLIRYIYQASIDKPVNIWLHRLKKMNAGTPQQLELGSSSEGLSRVATGTEISSWVQTLETFWDSSYHLKTCPTWLQGTMRIPPAHIQALKLSSRFSPPQISRPGS